MTNNEVFYTVIGIEEPSWAARAADFAVLVLDTLGKSNWQVSLTLCDDETIRVLNRDYRRIDAPTDVLSFSLGEWEPPDDHTGVYIAGDIIISIQTLARNAEEFAVSIDEELRRLIIHGILHLSGMDHATNEQDQPMLQLQEELVASLGGFRII